MPIDKLKRVVFPKDWNLKGYLKDRKDAIDRALEKLPQLPTRTTNAASAARKALATNGKRFRPLMVLATADLFERGSDPAIMAAALSVECIHTASLILDDLPCMDDASLRRGEPTLHTMVGEADTILAAMGLVAEAHHLLLNPAFRADKRQMAMSRMLTQAYSLDGLCGGQSDDLADLGSHTLSDLEFIHAKKDWLIVHRSRGIGLHLVSRPKS